MSSLHDPLKDPFELIGTGQEMENIVPFLAPNKVNQMIESALARPQVAPQRRLAVSTWKFAGMGIAACFAFLMIFAAPQQEQMDQMIPGEPAAIISHVSHVVQEPDLMQTASADDQEDVREFGDFVMLETLEKY